MSWGLKKWVFDSGRWTKHKGVYFLKKYDELSELVALAQKLRYFADQNGPVGGPHENEF